MDRPRIDPRLRRVMLDWAAPSTVMVIGIVNISRHPHSPEYPGAPTSHVLFLGIAVLALGLRGRAALLAPCIAIATVTGWLTLWPADLQGPFEGFVVLVGAAYCLGTLHSGRRFVTGAALLVAWFATGLAVGAVGGNGFGDVAPIAVWCSVGFAIGYLISRRTEQTRLAWEAAKVLAAEQERQTARAVEEERGRIARELHDVVAHGLSVIVVQAVAERRSLGSGAVDLADVDAALGSIEHAGREALMDLRRLLGLLRRTEEPATLAPQPGLAQLDELVRSVRAAGLQVDVEITGERLPLPSGLDLTAYRIIQEAMTNVLKHADARAVRLRLAFERNYFELDITDDGRAGAARSRFAAEGPGHGLIGMRERATVFGGTISAGHSSDGGWSVRARLPIAAAVPR